MGIYIAPKAYYCSVSQSFSDSILTQAAGGEGGATYGQWRVVVGPQPFYWGGTWATVATRCNNPELAKEFISFFTTDAETAQAYSESKGEYVSNQKAMEAVLANGSYTGVGVLGGQNPTSSPLRALSSITAIRWAATLNMSLAASIPPTLC